MNWTLKTEALKRYGYQCRLAQGVGVSEDRLSKLIHKRRKPTEDEKKRIAKALGLSVRELWT